MGSLVLRRVRIVAAFTVVLVGVAAAGASQGGALDVRAGSPSSPAALTVAGKVNIAVALDRTHAGSFRIRGAIADSGHARAQREVRGKRVRMTLTLHGTGGRIKLLVNQVCGKAGSTWTVYSGTRKYLGLSGGGKGVGRISCGKRAPHRSTYTGAVRTPPPSAIAPPGTFRGTGSNPNHRMTFDVLPNGLALANVSFRQLVARCEPPAVEFPAPRLAGPYALADDGRFSITEDGFTITGKVSGTTARGSVSYESGTCRAVRARWKASNPSQPLPLVSPGRYCGFTLAGGGVCIDASSDAWVTRTRFEVKLRCVAPSEATFVFEYVYGGALGIKSDLTFSGRLANVPLPGGGSLRFSVFGAFDDAGRVTGKGGISRVRIVRDGTMYTCRNAVASFSAKLGA